MGVNGFSLNNIFLSQVCQSRTLSSSIFMWPVTSKFCCNLY